MLFVASRDGRLVRQGFDGLALLEPPLARPAVARWSGIAHAFTDRVDRNWSSFVLAVPPVIAILCALPLVPFQSTRLSAVLLVLLGMLHVTAFLLATMAIPLLRRRSDDPDSIRLGLLAGTNWTMVLFHQENEARIDELFDRVRERLRRLLTDELRNVGSQAGVAVDESRLVEELVLLHEGVTTEVARDRIAVRNPRANRSEDEKFSMSTSDRHPDDPDRVAAPPLPFLKLFFVANVVFTLGIAQLLAWQERAVCAARPCTTAATEYLDALTWVGYQLIWRQAPGVEPASGFAVVIGWLLTAFLPLLLLVGVTATIRRNRYLATLRPGDDVKKTRLLIVTVTDVERDAVIDTFEKYTTDTVVPDFSGRVPIWRLGDIADTEAFLVQAAVPGNVGAGAVPMIASEAIRLLRPHCAIITGICYGLRPDEQELGDVLVSALIRDLDHAKLLESDGQVVRQDRGPNVDPSPVLHVAAKAAQRQWQHESGVPVHFGEMLSWNKLLNTEIVTDDLRQRYPNAIGGDMEGMGFHSVTRWADVQGILIKGICDWGHDKKDEHHAVAAANSASFALHLVKIGGLTGTRRTNT